LKLKVSVIFGTRPEAIKLCPLILQMRASEYFEVCVCVTGQHRKMLDQVLKVFDIAPDVDLDLMEPDQTLAGIAYRSIQAVDNYLANNKPDLIVVQGDTTTVFCAAYVAFLHKIKVAHVEAGLRTWDKYTPFPEEMNRVLTTRLADYHFAPTLQSRKNLLADGVVDERIFVTGNTVIDAQRLALEKVALNPPHITGLPQNLLDDRSIPLILVTGHRRENHGQGFENICQAIAELARQHSGVHFVYPVHLNPNVHTPVHQFLGGHANIHLIEPLPYLPFIVLMKRAKIILTDSGGIQEEAPSLGKPVLVMRETTERPEAIQAGTIRLVGTEPGKIKAAVEELLFNPMIYDQMACAVNPYGDGFACEKIMAVLQGIFCRISE